MIFQFFNNAQTTAEVCSYLTELSAQIKGKNARPLARALVQAADDYVRPVAISAAFFNKARYEIIPPEKAPQTFVALLLAISGNRVTDVRAALAESYKFLSKLREPDTPPLMPDDVKEVIQKVHIPGALNVITTRRPLLIICFRATDPEYNSSYIPRLNAVLVTAPRKYKEEDNHPTYVFLHELGHAFQIALTKDATAVPQSFLPVFHVTFGTHPEEVSVNHWPDIFADAFSLAMSYETDLAAFNPFCRRFHNFSQVGISRYFEMLTSEASENRDALLANGPFDIEWDAQRIGHRPREGPPKGGKNSFPSFVKNPKKVLPTKAT